MRTAVVVAVVMVIGTVFVASAWARSLPSGGIAGRVYIGPMHPVRHTLPGLDGDEIPYSAVMAVYDADDTHEITRVRSDEHGDFRFALGPGLYLLRPLQEDQPFPKAKAQLVLVRERVYTDTIVLYDLDTP
jgi:hypothetical protein